MMTPTLVGLAPCTRPLTRQRAAPRWGRWGGRRGWCCSAAGAGACTWLAAAPQCSFWERHTHTHTVPVSGERAAPNTSGFSPVCLSVLDRLLQLERWWQSFGKGRTGQWLTGEWLGGHAKVQKKKKPIVVLLKTQPRLGVSVQNSNRDKSTIWSLGCLWACVWYVEWNALPGIISVAVAIELVSGFEVQRPLVKFLQKSLLRLHHSELQKHGTNELARVRHVLYVRLWVCVNSRVPPGLWSTAGSGAHCWWTSGWSAGRGLRCGSSGRRSRTRACVGRGEGGWPCFNLVQLDSAWYIFTACVAGILTCGPGCAGCRTRQSLVAPGCTRAHRRGAGRSSCER